MTRDGITRLVIAGLALAGGLWLANATEWVEVKVDKPPGGAAARDNFFATELVLKNMGVRVERRQSLDALPPLGTRLLLTTQEWELFPQRAEQLRGWVEAGGHLVLPAGLTKHRDLDPWMPIRSVEGPRIKDLPARRVPAKEAFCRELREPTALQAPGSDGQAYRLCAVPLGDELQARDGVAPQWQLTGPRGTEMLRAPLGRGSVTAFTSFALLANREVLLADHALALATALQLESGSSVWLVTEEARAPLLAWLWQTGWIALLLALAALALWLWRGAVRFGPVGAAPALQRRSMREQVAGTGAFLQQNGTAALHAAQLRALLEAARNRLPGFAAQSPVAAPQVIARATGLDANALTRAMQSGARVPERLPAELELLEAARRRLLQAQAQQRTP